MKAIGAKSFPPARKYRPYAPVALTDRSWPSRTITAAPIWCSVDLRDGNQALINPMSITQKLQMFKLLCEIGFKEIEVGFPSAAEIEFEFVRRLIDEDLIPSDVTPQILTQTREHLIRRSFEALRGAKRAIFHIYNSTSELQRRVVFGLDKPAIKKIATDATLLVRELSEKCDTEIVLEYSPESFTGTELDYALEVSEAVAEIWQPTPQRKMILNLPATVEMSTPNIHADQIEWFHRNLSRRESIILSLHPHNDRGTAVAAAELGLMAGADRVEGTLFGNGERTGNVDLVTLALNMYSQGIDPRLDLSDLPQIIEVCEKCTEIKNHPRWPYGGELVFTAFSGSHQDAIRKGMHCQREGEGRLWEVPYLPIDPTDIGRSYEAIIRINSQSGKGGVAYVLETEFGCVLPKLMHPEVSSAVQKFSEVKGKEVLPAEVWKIFEAEFINQAAPLEYVDFRSANSLAHKDRVECAITLNVNGKSVQASAVGNGPINAATQALADYTGQEFQLSSYFEHALTSGSGSQAISYICVVGANGASRWGVGIDNDITKSSVRALISAINRLLKS